MALHTHGGALRTAGVKVMRNISFGKNVMKTIRTQAQLDKLKAKLKKKK